MIFKEISVGGLTKEALIQRLVDAGVQFNPYARTLFEHRWPENDENHPTGFYLRNSDNSLWLRGYRVTGDPDWPTENEFVFCKES